MTDSTRGTFGSRLRYAINQSEYSIRGFQEEISGAVDGGITYPTINSYLKDDTEPRRDFVEAAAKILGVRSAWLAFGDGEPTEDQQGRQARDWTFRALVAAQKQEAHLIRYELDLGDPPQYDLRATALFRFTQKLDHALHRDAPWATPAARALLLEEVGRLLVGIDQLYATRNVPLRGDEPTRPHSGCFVEDWDLNKGGFVLWYDAILGLLSQRIAGLGKPLPPPIPTAPSLTEGQETGAAD